MKLYLFLSAVLFSIQAAAADLSPNEITEKFKLLVGDQVEVTTEQSPIPNIYQIISNGKVLYVSKDGKHVLSGNLYSFDEEFENKTDVTLRLNSIKRLEKYDSYITFESKNEKHIVYVFTDFTCDYCKKLHRSLDEYNNHGITIKYIPWPRGGEFLQNGETSPTFESFRNALCSDNRKAAINSLFISNSSPQVRKCSAETLRNYIKLGKDVGVKATPILISSNGLFLPGFKEPDVLLNILDRQ